MDVIYVYFIRDLYNFHYRTKPFRNSLEVQAFLRYLMSLDIHYIIETWQQNTDQPSTTSISTVHKLSTDQKYRSTQLQTDHTFHEEWQCDETRAVVDTRPLPKWHILDFSRPFRHLVLEVRLPRRALTWLSQ